MTLSIILMIFLVLTLRRSQNALLMLYMMPCKNLDSALEHRLDERYGKYLVYKKLLLKTTASVPIGIVIIYLQMCETSQILFQHNAGGSKKCTKS